jgi:hypothetical protein
MSLMHRLKHFRDEGLRNLLVEEITHGVDKYCAWLTPAQGQSDQIRLQGNFESIAVPRLVHARKAIRHPFGIAVLAPRADLRAACDGIPSPFRPFD